VDNVIDYMQGGLLLVFTTSKIKYENYFPINIEEKIRCSEGSIKCDHMG
jgi:hypothetical protein